MNDLQKLNNLIQNASCITIAVHTHPDGDAIGSGLGMRRFLAGILGKDALLAIPDSIPESLAFMAKDEDKILAFSENPEEVQARIDRSDLIICLDCNSFIRTAGLESALRAAKVPKILIDHHLNPDREAFDLVFSETEISSASELLYWTLKKLPQIDGDERKFPMSSLEAMLTGMTTDTNNFANSVFPSTLQMASELIAAGVDRDGILTKLYNNYRENRIRLMGHLLSKNLKITPDGVAYMILDRTTQQEFDYRQGETEGFVNMPLAIAGVRMSIFLTEDDGKFRVSIRSRKGTSANRIATEYFNGGGHEQASGGKLFIPKDIAKEEEAEAYILKVTKRFFSE